MRRDEIDPEKLRDMLRSLLPSTARVMARKAKAMENRAARRTGRKADHSLTVSDRRASDKVAPFLRWCERITSGMSVQEKREFVRALLPRTLIGNHAFAHWEMHLRYPRVRTTYRERRRRREQSDYDRLRARLRQALAKEPDLLGRLNAAIKARKPFDQPRRLLHGVHDIDAFARDILTAAHADERAAARAVLS